MIVVLKKGCPKEEVERLTNWIEHFHVSVNPIVGEETTILGLVGDTSAVEKDTLMLNHWVDRVMKVQEPFKLANRQMHPNDTVVKIGGNVEVGGKKIVVMAGPCSVESEPQICEIAEEVQRQGAAILRGGAWKPRSSPYSFQGMKAQGLDLLCIAKEKTGMPIVTEITNPAHIELFEGRVDCYQVGARNMQNFELLKELGKTNTPILLKRGFANTLEEFLMSAEYIMAGGNDQVILCERGIRTFESYTRNTLDISAVPALKHESHLPVVVDPSHASGIPWMVEPLSKAAVAAGADGLMIEVHPSPKNAACDGKQSLTPSLFGQIMKHLDPVAQAVGRSLT